jgi:hypothetical protein
MCRLLRYDDGDGGNELPIAAKTAATTPTPTA